MQTKDVPAWMLIRISFIDGAAVLAFELHAQVVLQPLNLGLGCRCTGGFAAFEPRIGLPQLIVSQEKSWSILRSRYTTQRSSYRYTRVYLPNSFHPAVKL